MCKWDKKELTHEFLRIFLILSQVSKQNRRSPCKQWAFRNRPACQYLICQCRSNSSYSQNRLRKASLHKSCRNGRKSISEVPHYSHI